MKLVFKVSAIVSLALCVSVGKVSADEIPLMAAVQEGDIDSIRSLLRAKANVDTARADG
ncbi:MAG: ankyrin repeat domain-containing protein, partial [Gammaproteobacteria bacterium]|nr:ankyrin repeat domain-containing protein [Gammaproteobacteria bacterium]